MRSVWSAASNSQIHNVPPNEPLSEMVLVWCILNVDHCGGVTNGCTSDRHPQALRALTACSLWPIATWSIWRCETTVVPDMAYLQEKWSKCWHLIVYLACALILCMYGSQVLRGSQLRKPLWSCQQDLWVCRRLQVLESFLHAVCTGCLFLKSKACESHIAHTGPYIFARTMYTYFRQGSHLFAEVVVNFIVRDYISILRRWTYFWLVITSLCCDGRVFLISDDIFWASSWFLLLLLHSRKLKFVR